MRLKNPPPLGGGVCQDAKSDQAQLFFKKVQNKMLWATTHHTAAELIVDRANPKLPNMGLRSWQGSRVRQQDVTIALQATAKLIEAPAKK